MTVVIVIVFHPFHMMALTFARFDEFAVARVSAVSPAMVRAPMTRRPHILVTTVPVSWSLRVIWTVPYFDAYFCSSRRDAAEKKNRQRKCHEPCFHMYKEFVRRRLSGCLKRVPAQSEGIDQPTAASNRDCVELISSEPPST